jgi:hypothetical protein
MTKEERRNLRLAKAKIWSERIRMKNAVARAKGEVKQIQILNKQLKRQCKATGGGGRNEPIMVVMKDEEVRFLGQVAGGGWVQMR